MFRVFSILLALVVVGCQQQTTPNHSEKANPAKTISSPYNDYLNSVEKAISDLSDNQQKARKEKLSALHSTKTYEQLITKKIVDAKYLPVLSAIAEGISSINEGGFLVGNESMQVVQEMDNPKDRITFVTTTILIAQPKFGGLTREFVDLFARYKDQYRYYGDAGTLIQNVETGQSTTIEHNFDLSSFFAMVQPSDPKALDAVYEARKKGISSWWSSDRNYLFPYLARQEGYNSYLKKVYPSSPYLVNVDYSMTAEELFKAYDNNEVAADDKFKGKKIQVTGIVDNITKDIMGNPYISLAVDILQDVNCYFSQDDLNSLSQLNKGDKVKIIGTCQGKVLNVSVKLDDCQIQ